MKIAYISQLAPVLGLQVMKAPELLGVDILAVRLINPPKYLIVTS
jgi:hypothetical protein